MGTTAPEHGLSLLEGSTAAAGTRPDEVVLAISPGFADFFTQTITEISHAAEAGKGASAAGPWSAAHASVSIPSTEAGTLFAP